MYSLVYRLDTKSEQEVVILLTTLLQVAVQVLVPIQGPNPGDRLFNAIHVHRTRRVCVLPARSVDFWTVESDDDISGDPVRR